MFASHSHVSFRARWEWSVGLLLSALLTLTLPARSHAVDSIQTVDAAGDVGLDTSVVLDANGFPVISYYDDTNGDLKLLHCNDANCTGNNESIQAVDTGGNVGSSTSLVLDANGFPVISYVDVTNGDLKLLHCNDANCVGSDESIQTVDAGSTTQYQFPSLALDAHGFPVISYHEFFNGDLKLVHCNDANCAGNNESILTVDSVGYLGLFTSLVLDANGFPVISYYDNGNGYLKLLHCNDANCTGNDDSIQAVDTIGNVGWFSSLALDANGFPVISYFGAANSDLKLVHCNDANCVGNNESIVTVDSAGTVGQHTSLTLDANGFPVISYYDASRTTRDLKLVHCNDANCTGNDESIRVVDTNGDVGLDTSLVLDANGFPVISYFDNTNRDLKLAHCDDANCNRPPVAQCQDVTIDATATSCSFPASINNGSSDPDTGDTITLSQAPAGLFGLGGTLATLTVTDSQNATATCTGTVTVRDTTPPPLSCPGPVTAECAGASTAVTFATPQPGVDNCGLSQSTGCNPASGTGFGLSSTTVRCEATDTRNTTSCSFSVNVVDTIAPSITCPAAQTVEATSAAGANVSFTPPAASDTCTTPSVSCDATSGATFILGTTTVHCTASDGPHSTLCSFGVTVRDTTAPTLTCPANVTVTTGQPVSLGTPSVSDLVDANPTVSNNAPASYSTGTTTVTWTARDAAGNTSSCQQTVQVTYAFTGFFQPVDNPDIVNVAKAGQGIPVKFSLGGNFGLNILAPGSPSTQNLACNGGTADDIETVSSGSSGLSYDATTNTYTYVWKTQKAWAGQCRQLTVTLSDGTTHTANFQFK